MSVDSKSQVVELLAKCSRDEAKSDELLPLVYEELRKLVSGFLSPG
jgi:hypothetical protein